MNKGLVALGVIVLVAVGAYALLSLGVPAVGPAKTTTTLATAATGYSYMPVQITDPPQVPNGTSALVISYSSVAVHTEGGVGSGWLSSNTGGTVDLMAALNVSKTIGVVAVPNGSVVNIVRFNISSAEITVNGIVYNVTVPSSHVQVNLEQSARANGNSSVLLSLSPAVVSILTSNTTVFVMVPSVKAVVVPHGANQSSIMVGFQARLNESVKAMIEESGANISITSAALSSTGNMTSLSVTVKNNGNQSVAIRHIMLFGNLTVSVNGNAVTARINNLSSEVEDQARNASVCANVAGGPSIDSNAVGSENEGSKGNVSINGNGTYNTSGGSHSGYGAMVNTSGSGASETEFRGFGEDSANAIAVFNMHANASVCTTNGLNAFLSQLRGNVEDASGNAGMAQARFRVMNFLTVANGTLTLPFTSEDVNDTGYNISAGTSRTFTFNGVVSTGDSVLTIVPTAGKQYRVVAGGEEGAYATANVTDA